MDINPNEGNMQIQKMRIDTSLSLKDSPWPPVKCGDTGFLELPDGTIIRFNVYEVERK